MNDTAAKPPATSHPKRIEMVSTLLRDAGEPRNIVQIRQGVRERWGYGVDMSDQSLYNSIYTALDRHPELFKRLEGNRWTLTPEGERATDNGLFGEED